ncbi:PspA/IM30 family protein [Rheinheimera nanhaiensis]|uniref:PspA/IM30 family protein n=1 Tax=Rheinheimera nanhaiensis E407-8 TaxID=562729 RepID=I1E141_9GAMM|nr:PspA/IM30 family protein [Rheinheimera nanhaiensis]GAB60019.1 PspA/IM30 family protein [Rheinheimera nanhaiensis E407-8]
MSESITRRVARLVSGSVNAIVDAVENSAPETVMEQAIRELDVAIADTRSELGQQVAQKHLASKKLMEENSRYEALASQLEVAVANGRDDLAEAGIAEQMDIEARIPVLEAAIADGAAREKELEGFVQALQAKKREMQAELRAFVQAQQASSQAASTAAQRVDTAADKAGRASDAFGRVLEKASGIAGRDTNLSNAGKLAELEDLARKNRVAERLAALKAGKN